jgi:hypothetical protein
MWILHVVLLMNFISALLITFYPDDAGSWFFRNVDNFLSVWMYLSPYFLPGFATTEEFWES